jgi:hypothetical protein
MKKSLLIALILILIVLGAWLTLGKSKQANAPISQEQEGEVAATSETPESKDVSPAIKEFTISGENFKFVYPFHYQRK